MYHSNSQLTAWVGGSGSIHVGKEDKQVKQHYYLPSSYWSHDKNYTDEGQQYNNTSQRMLCQIERKKYLPTWTKCDPVSY